MDNAPTSADSLEPCRSQRTRLVHLRCRAMFQSARGARSPRGPDEALCAPGKRRWTERVPCAEWVQPEYRDDQPLPSRLLATTCGRCREILAEIIGVECPQEGIIRRERRAGGDEGPAVGADGVAGAAGNVAGAAGNVAGAAGNVADIACDVRVDPAPPMAAPSSASEAPPPEASLSRPSPAAVAPKLRKIETMDHLAYALDGAGAGPVPYGVKIFDTAGELVSAFQVFGSHLAEARRYIVQALVAHEGVSPEAEIVFGWSSGAVLLSEGYRRGMWITQGAALHPAATADAVAVPLRSRKPHISASQVTKFLQCPRQWAYQYVRGVRSPGSGATAQGSAWHAAIEHGYREVQAGYALPDVSHLQDVFAAEFRSKLAEEDVRLRGWENVEDLHKEGLLLVEAHRTHIAPDVSPLYVEHESRLGLGEDFPFDLLGYIDVITTDGWIRDNKSRSQKRGFPSQKDVDGDVQLGIYALLYRAEFQKREGGLALDVCVKHGPSAPPGVRIVETTRTAAQVQWVLGLVEQMARAITAEAYVPNPTGWWCAERWCEFWKSCMVDGDHDIVRPGALKLGAAVVSAATLEDEG